MGKVRSSNLELLRIVSMVLIVSSHFATHGNWIDKGSSLASEFALGFLQIGGEVGVNCFVLISGYFLVKSRFKTISLLKVILSTLFYSWAILAIFGCFDNAEIGLSALVKSLIPTLSGEYWFVTTFVCMLLLSPILRRLVAGMSRESWGKMLMILFVSMSVLPTLVTFDFMFTKIGWFCFLFLFAGYVRTFDVNPSVKKVAILVLLNLALIAISIAVISVLSMRYPSLLTHKAYFVEMNIFLEFGLSIGVFFAFKRLSLGGVGTINHLAASAFSVYLITDNPLVRAWLWPHFGWVYWLNPLVIVFVGYAVAMLLYCACHIVDWARRTAIERPLLNTLSKGVLRVYISRIDGWFEVVERDKGCDNLELVGKR